MTIKINFEIISFFILFVSILNSNVTNLDEDNFDKIIGSSKESWLIEIFSERCESCRSFEPKWTQLVKKIDYLNIGRINIDEPKGMNLANKLNALENGIPCVRLNYGKDKTEDIMIGTEEPFPSAKTLQNRVDTILKKKGKLQNGKYLINEDL